MNGIDTAIASLLASRVDSLLNIAPGATGASQTGASALSTDAPVTPGSPEIPAPPPASAQTALSAVALTLNAIALSGGDVATAILGQLPIWPAAPAIDVEVAELPLFDAMTGQAGNAAAAGNAANAAGTASASGTAATAATSVAASPVPVAALAAALEQTVSGSGLFYEAHLAQWLAGQFTPADLANEPQNRLLDPVEQLPLDWAADAEAGAQSGAGSASASAQPVRPGSTPTANNGPEGNTAARPAATIQSPQAARFVAGEVLANSLSDLSAQPERSALHAAVTQTSDAPSQASQSVAAAISAATVPLVRQQLDMLATGQFRWTGEAWPGAKFDWTIQQEGDEWERGGGGAGAEEDYPWRTRLTLSLPLLGTVDAELTLSGNRLAARVLASPLGAARLVEQSDGFRQRLAAAGIELSGLSIREVGGAVPTGAPNAAAAAAAQAAASAYARTAPADAEPDLAPPRRSFRTERAQRPERAERATRPSQPGRPERAQWPSTTTETDFDWDM
ncbi:flagellar hook-length control protein FliK [Paraburkholderia sp. BCC1885]|uniref:flagellar hook-length control protein FliK n=1 Tax=Paraburkholderia sp. BCC1885 TaxID=2562669 RepID=UPI0011829397|nr:flagellar hook-length control protein FliK [Paraburkholderia sp. BCC1885]